MIFILNNTTRKKCVYLHLGDCIRLDWPLRRPEDGELPPDVFILSRNN